MNHVYILLLLVLVIGPACTWHACDSDTVEFELPAPGDAVEVVLKACPDRRADAQLSITLSAQGDPQKPLAVNVDGIGIGLDGDGWAGRDLFSEAVGPEDCDPGRRVTVRRLDNDPGVSFIGTVSIELSAPSRTSCSAEITVNPL